MSTERAEAIRGLLAEGMSRRAIAARLGVSEKTVRNILNVAETSAPLVGSDRTLLPIDPLTGKHPIPADKRYVQCTCGGPAWRIGTTNEWECQAPAGPRGPHAPRQVRDETGTPQLVWGPFRIRPFPLPPEAA